VKVLTVSGVSPMPVMDILTIDYALGKAANVTVTLTDILGKTIKTSTFNAHEGTNNAAIDLSPLSNGSYLLTVNDGESVVVKRVVKQ
jgi:bifunctional ADP-heptose synthase (sugar kinase/adenylyltransferase)